MVTCPQCQLCKECGALHTREGQRGLGWKDQEKDKQRDLGRKRSREQSKEKATWREAMAEIKLDGLAGRLPQKTGHQLHTDVSVSLSLNLKQVPQSLQYWTVTCQNRGT